MNRRDFVKVGGASLAVSPLLVKSAFGAGHSIFENCPDFLEVFQILDFTDGREPYVLVEPKGWPDQKIEQIIFKNPRDVTDPQEGTLLVPPFTVNTKSPAELNCYAMQTILAASNNRNLIVFDSNAKTGEITVNLYTMMYNLIRKESGGTTASPFRKKPITDVFVRASKAPKQGRLLSSKSGSTTIDENVYHTTSAKWHPIPDKIWDCVEDYYTNYLHGVYPSDKKNLLIALTTEDSRWDFVYALLSKSKRSYSQECGMAILDNRRILLGTF